MVLKEKYLFSLYILLWILYKFQGLLWTEGNFLSQIILVSLTLFSVFYALKVNLDGCEKPVYFIALNILLVMFTIYGTVYILEGEHFYQGGATFRPSHYLKCVYNSLLPIYVFYYFSFKNILTQRMLCALGYVFLIMVVVSYFMQNLEVKNQMMENGIEGDDFVNNFGYDFLCLFPILSFYRKRTLFTYLIILCVMTFILMSMKRGAVFIGFFCMVWFLVEMFMNAKKLKKVLIILLSVCLVVVLFSFVLHMLETSDFFIQRVQSTMEGKTSGRDILFSTLSDYFLYDTDAFQFFFGSGANATLEISSKYAHNDWLELLVNQGALGLAIYLFYWISFFSVWRKMKGDASLYFPFGLLLFIFFMKTFFSFSYGGMNVYSTSVMGFCLGSLQRKRLALDS